MDNTVFEIDGARFEFDVSDADQMEKYEQAFRNLNDSKRDINEKESLSEKLRYTCRLYEKLIDDIFGKNASSQISSMQNSSVIKHERVIESLIEFVNTQGIENDTRRREFFGKYIPSGRKDV